MTEPGQGDNCVTKAAVPEGVHGIPPVVVVVPLGLAAAHGQKVEEDA